MWDTDKESKYVISYNWSACSLGCSSVQGTTLTVGSSWQHTVTEATPHRNKNRELFIYHMFGLNMQIEHYIESL
jgi:hypothetical protein